MARSSWKGYLKLSLVSCAVALYNASSSSDRVSFNTLNRKTGNRLKQNMVDSVTGEPVDTADRVKGYQVSKGQYVMVEDTEIEALKIESTKTIEIETFVPAAEIDEIYLDSPYYLAPDDKVAEEAFAVIREAMTRKKMVGIGRIVLARRERMLMLQPRDKGMLATTLRYPYEVRAGSEIFDEISDVKLPGEMLDIAQEIINRMSGHFEPETFTDRYEEAVVSMLKAKQAGQTFTVPEPSQPANVVNIMDALKKSLEAAGGDGALRRPRAPSKKAEAPAAKEKETARKPAPKQPVARKAARG
jgi:DNA end-binding protein Ku